MSKARDSIAREESRSDSAQTTSRNRVGLLCSSVTGNTEQIARALHRSLIAEGYELIEDIDTLTKDVDIPVIVCFWCWRSTLDPRSAKRVARLSGHTIIPVGTLGAHPRGTYADKVARRVREDSIAAGALPTEVFLCQGKIPEKRLAERRKIPKGEPHYVSPKKLMQLLEGQHHPDALDEYQALLFVKEALKTIDIKNEDD